MEVDVRQLGPCKVALNIQVPPEQITETIDSVFNRFAKRTTVPGFRKGKAPRKLAERYIDVDAVREAAMDQVIQDAYQEALKETGIQPYDQASVELKEFEEGQPLAFTATVPTRPEIEIGDYQAVEVRRVVVPIGELEVSRELQRVREQAARFEEAQEQQADEYIDRDLVAEVVKRSTVHFPQSMVDEEVAHRVDTLLKGLERRGIQMDAYLTYQNKTLADLEAQYAEEARQMITN